jgi:hypothetical protein
MKFEAKVAPATLLALLISVSAHSLLQEYLRSHEEVLQQFKLIFWHIYFLTLFTLGVLFFSV